jgi:hypothetical protein
MERGLALCTATFLLLFAYLLIERVRLGALQEEVEDLTYALRRRPAIAPSAGGTGG